MFLVIEVQLKDLGEEEVLRRLRSLTAKTNLLPDDDASAINLCDSEVLLLNVDGFVASTDAPPGMPYQSMGEKAALMAISDIVIKGGTARGFLLSVSVPSDFLMEDLIEIVQGAKQFTAQFDIPFLGGDLNQANDIVLDAVAIGTAKNNNVIPRTGAKAGDIIVSSKWFGLTAIGLNYLLSGNDYGLSEKVLEATVREVYSPRPWFSEFFEIATRIPITSSIDSSDGLGKSLHHLANASNKRIVISSLPIHPLLEKCLPKEYWFSSVFYGGEEFCPIFTVPSDNIEALPDYFMCIGRVETGSGVIFSTKDAVREVLPKGWEHFKEK